MNNTWKISYKIKFICLCFSYWKIRNNCISLGKNEPWAFDSIFNKYDLYYLKWKWHKDNKEFLNASTLNVSKFSAFI